MKSLSICISRFIDYRKVVMFFNLYNRANTRNMELRLIILVKRMLVMCLIHRIVDLPLTCSLYYSCFVTLMHIITLQRLSLSNSLLLLFNLHNAHITQNPYINNTLLSSLCLTLMILMDYLMV